MYFYQWIQFDFYKGSCNIAHKPTTASSIWPLRLSFPWKVSTVKMALYWSLAHICWLKFIIAERTMKNLCGFTLLNDSIWINWICCKTVILNADVTSLWGWELMLGYKVLLSFSLPGHPKGSRQGWATHVQIGKCCSKLLPLSWKYTVVLNIIACCIR